MARVWRECTEPHPILEKFSKRKAGFPWVRGDLCLENNPTLRQEFRHRFDDSPQELILGSNFAIFLRFPNCCNHFGLRLLDA
jgi:hypothetical protein